MRKEWKYDTIEYSLIPDEKERKRWENFWIKKYEEENDGFRPVHNKNSGRGV